MKSLFSGLTIFLLLASFVNGQNPEFRTWNVGVKLGVESYFLPSLEGYYKNLSLDITPFSFYQKIGATGRFLPFQIKKKVQIFLTGRVAGERFNNNYFLSFNNRVYYYSFLDRISLIVSVGPEVYFLKRFSAQSFAGFRYSRFLEDPIIGDLGIESRINLALSFSVQMKLFQNFKP